MGKTPIITTTKPILMSQNRIIFQKRLKTDEEKNLFYMEKMKIVLRCANYLYLHGAKRVWLFGSLADCSHIDQLTDIDIAVEGIRKQDIYRIQRNMINKEKTKIDIICLETTNPSFRYNILKKRVLISKSKITNQP